MTVVYAMVAMPVWMNVVSAMVITVPAQIVAECRMVLLTVVMVNVVPVMMKLMKVLVIALAM